jgi:AcrR family transcriptional regulator
VARPKSYDRDGALVAARDVFWERGYGATSVSDVEQRTGLNRSSLYHDFGSKQQLFESSLRCYLDRVIGSLFEPLRAPEACVHDVAAMFFRLGELFRSAPDQVAQGCLMVNTIAELGPRTFARAAGLDYRDRVRSDFATALGRSAARGEVDAAGIDGRAHLLCAALMGIWLSVRVDPVDAAHLCDLIGRQVEAWRRPAR